MERCDKAVLMSLLSIWYAQPHKLEKRYQAVRMAAIAQHHLFPNAAVSLIEPASQSTISAVPL
jgi:hypothetical protein